MLADRFGITAAVWAIAALTAASGVVVAVRMYETHRRAPAGTILPSRRDRQPARDETLSVRDEP